MIILGIHAGQHAASATLCDDHRVLAAVQMERLTRIKGAGVSPDKWAWPCARPICAGFDLPAHRLCRDRVRGPLYDAIVIGLALPIHARYALLALALGQPGQRRAAEGGVIAAQVGKHLLVGEPALPEQP
jgi:hypothetical protein